MTIARENNAIIIIVSKECVDNVLQASNEQLFYDLAVIKLTYSSVMLYWLYQHVSTRSTLYKIVFCLIS